jgi:hypothetical protein
METLLRKPIALKGLCSLGVDTAIDLLLEKAAEV